MRRRTRVSRRAAGALALLTLGAGAGVADGDGDGGEPWRPLPERRVAWNVRLSTTIEGEAPSSRGDRGPRPLLPKRLSETGVFADTAALEPHPAAIPYEVKVPLWSDAAGKERFVLLPGTAKLVVDASGALAFPVGTVFVKSFFLETTTGDPTSRRRLETRLFIRGEAGWAGFGYAWNEEQTDARLVESPEVLRLEITARDGTRARRKWVLPSPTDCMTCHTPGAGRVLGFELDQLGGDDDFPAGKTHRQLEGMTRLGVFDGPLPKGNPGYPDWENAAAPIGRRVRAYLDVNCASCHHPGGSGNSKIDLRWEVGLDAMNLIDAKPGLGDLGVRGAKQVTPGKPAASVLWLRMGMDGQEGMPPLGHEVLDEVGLEALAEWIRSLGTAAPEAPGKGRGKREVH